MQTTRCVNCGKPPTNDERCPRCGNDWNVKAPPRVVELFEHAIAQVEWAGRGVVRRAGEIVNQPEPTEGRNA